MGELHRPSPSKKRLNRASFILLNRAERSFLNHRQHVCVFILPVIPKNRHDAQSICAGMKSWQRPAPLPVPTEPRRAAIRDLARTEIDANLRFGTRDGNAVPGAVAGRGESHMIGIMTKRYIFAILAFAVMALCIGVDLTANQWAFCIECTWNLLSNYGHNISTADLDRISAELRVKIQAGPNRARARFGQSGLTCALAD
jgi:hypothetical protein